MIKECKKHGLTKHSKQGNDKNKRFRCLKCGVEAVTKRRKKIKLLAIEYKGSKCNNCGYNKYPAVLEFHHLESEKKEFSISGKGNIVSWEKLKIELDKCVLLCANCHRELHFLEDNN